MSISHEEIQLNAAQQAQIAALAEMRKKPWRELLNEALDNLQTNPNWCTLEKPRRRQAGNGKGKVWMAPDFDAPLDDFTEYM